MERIKVDRKLLLKIVKDGNLESFYKDKAKSFEYQGQKYVYTWGIGDGKGISYSVVICRKAILLEDYNGTIEPLRYYDHSVAVDKGVRERGYYARLVDIDGVAYVLTNEIEFIEYMKKQSLTQIIQHVVANVQVAASFNNGSHIEFILVKNALQEHYLIWLPVTLDTCMLFNVKMKPEKLIKEFQEVPLQNRITYILENFITSDYHDIEQKHSNYLQKRINYGLHN